MCEKLLETLFSFPVWNWDYALNLKPRNVDESLGKKHNPFIIHSGLVWNTKCLLIFTSWFSQVSKLTHDKSTCTLSHAHWHVFLCTLHIATCMYWQVVKHGSYFMSHRAWAKEQDQIFLQYSSHINKKKIKCFLTPRKFFLMMWKNIFSHVHGWMIFINENVNDKLQWMKFFKEHWQ